MDVHGINVDVSLDDAIDEAMESVGGGRGRRGGGGRGRGRRGGRGRGRRGGGRPAPYNSRQVRNGDGAALIASDARVLKISMTTDVKKIAGAIAHVSRDGEPPVLLATGPACLNTASKALAIARNYVNGEAVFDLRGQPEFESDESGACTIMLTKSQHKPHAVVAVEDTDLSVKPTSDPWKVAGAIAGRIRSGERVALLAYGAESVFFTVKSIAVARRYLRQDGFDLVFAPHFVTLNTSSGEERQALKFTVLANQI